MISVNIQKAKDISHQKRRLARQKEFEPYDKIIALQIPGQELADAEIARQGIRDKYVIIQDQIDLAQTVDELKTILENL